MTRVLVVERDEAIATTMARALDSLDFKVDRVASTREAERGLDDRAYAVAVVDEVAGSGSLLDEVRQLRARWPRVAVIATGTLLSQPVLIELLRLGVVDALPKPFLPHELREAVERARSSVDARDFAAAIDGARTAIVHGDDLTARAAIARAYAAAPLDPDVIALDALLAELNGDDVRADRLYRVALVLQGDEGGAPDPTEGLARLASYGAARPVAELPRSLELVGAKGALPGQILLATVGLGGDRLHLRRAGDRMFATSLGDDRPESQSRVAEALGASSSVAARSTLCRDPKT